MKNLQLLKIICFVSLNFYLATSHASNGLRVSIPKMPVHSVNAQEGVLVDFSKVLASKLGRTVDIQIVPFSRSIYYVSTNKVDFHLPFIKPKFNNKTDGVFASNSKSAIKKSIDQSPDKFIYSDETIFYVNFVLYSHKDSSVDTSKLANYHIETDSAHLPFFHELKMGSDCILCSLKKVQHKMTDGYIFADSSTDPLLRENNTTLSSIKRQFYQRFEVKIVFPNTGEGHKLNKTLSAIIAKMRLSGELNELLAVVNFPYDDWQLPSP